MHPISRNKVRVLADNTAFQPDVDIIDRYGMILEITESNDVLISSYKDLNVTQVDGDPDFPNKFFIERTRFKSYKVFLIKYNYVNNSGNTIEMREELRLEFIEE